MKYKHRFNQQPALRFRQFTRKRWALFACLGRVVTISVLSVATLKSASAATDDVTTKVELSDDDQSTDKEVKLRDLEVTGSLAPLATGQAARMVTVLSREDIQAAPVQSINDLLKMVCAVDVRQRGAIGAQTDVSIRGGTQEQMTVLLNGINICDPQTGHNTMDLPCDISDILRIEVLEGPAGRAYGTSSMGGAINIVTSLPPAPSKERGSQAQVRMEGGSFGYLSTAGRAALPQQSLSASYTRSDGYSRAKSGSLNADYKGVKAFYQGNYSITPHLSPLTSDISYYAGVSTKGFGSNTFYSAKYDEQYEKTTKLFTALQADVRCKMTDEGSRTAEWHLKPAIYWNRSWDRFELIRGSEARVPFNHHRTDVFGINLHSWFDWQLGRTALGAEFRNEDIVSSNLGETLNKPSGHYMKGLNRSNLSLHLEHNVLLHSLTLSAGFIAAKNTWNEMPFTLYPGIDASYRLSNHLKVYASYNSSLRMPSFTELYYSVGGHKADKYLKAEELQALEGGIKYSSPLITVKASIFYNHCRNMIDWVMDTREPEAEWQSVNLTKVNTLGQEVSFSVHSSKFTVHSSYCHLHQQKQQEPYLQSQYSLEYLRHKLTTSLAMPLTRRLSLTVKYRFQDRTGNYTDTSGEARDYRPYSIVDSRLSWEAERYALYVEGNNLLNTRYVDYGNVPQPGCWLMVGAKISCFANHALHY
jgi:iron complex outermembrane receptor protein